MPVDISSAKDFVNSKSMITPGLAGGLVMFLANALIGAFNMDVYRSFFVLALSFLIGAVVFADDKVGFLLRSVLYIINSLIIFSVAMGTNSIGKKAEDATQQQINSVIQPISEIETEDLSLFRFAQYTPIDSNKIKLDLLHKQIKTISNSILLVQDELVKNQRVYNDPSHKLNTLVGINDNLLTIKRGIERTPVLSNTNFIKVQSEVAEVHHNVQTMQRALLLEKKQNPKQKFFKDWN